MDEWYLQLYLIVDLPWYYELLSFGGIAASVIITVAQVKKSLGDIFTKKKSLPDPTTTLSNQIMSPIIDTEQTGSNNVNQNIVVNFNFNGSNDVNQSQIAEAMKGVLAPENNAIGVSTASFAEGTSADSDAKDIDQIKNDVSPKPSIKRVSALIDEKVEFLCSEIQDKINVLEHDDAYDKATELYAWYNEDKTIFSEESSQMILSIMSLVESDRERRRRRNE